MKSIQVFDPASTANAQFTVDEVWAREHGAAVQRFNPLTDTQVFSENPTVKLYVARSGEEALPLVLLNGEIALAGRYPTRAELSRWAGI